MTVMKIGILSDSHGRREIVRQALAELEARGGELVVHCGDIDDPETVHLFQGWPAHFVLGNCDWDEQGLRQAMAQAGATLHEQFGHLDLEGAAIAFTHGHDHRLLHELEHCGQYDFVFYGHTHVAAEHQTGATRVINPGALHRARPKAFVVLELPGRHIETVTLADW
jgi:putative phosphoesterase